MRTSVHPIRTSIIDIAPKILALEACTDAEIRKQFQISKQQLWRIRTGRLAGLKKVTNARDSSFSPTTDTGQYGRRLELENEENSEKQCANTSFVKQTQTSEESSSRSEPRTPSTAQTGAGRSENPVLHPVHEMDPSTNSAPSMADQASVSPGFGKVDFRYCFWLSLKAAAAKISVSEDSIGRRAVPWQQSLVPQHVRYKLLKLDEGTRQVRRYFEPDLEALFVDPSEAGMWCYDI